MTIIKSPLSRHLWNWTNLQQSNTQPNRVAFYFRYNNVVLKQTGSFISVRHLLMQRNHPISNTQAYYCQHYTFKSFHLIKVTWKLSGCLWIMYIRALSHHQDLIAVSRRDCFSCASSPLPPLPTPLNVKEALPKAPIHSLQKLSAHNLCGQHCSKYWA